ncbi:MAG: hypothetical protein RL173_282 [Fibrobacterota bacterium]
MSLASAPADTVRIDLWRAGVQYMTLGYKRDGANTDLKPLAILSENVVAIEILKTILPSTDPAAFVQELAKRLVANDSLVRGTGFPANSIVPGIDNNAVLDSAMSILVVKGLPLSAVIPGTGAWALGLDTIAIHVRINVLVTAGKISADTAKLFPPYPVRLKSPVTLDSVLVAGGATTSVKGSFEATYQLSGKLIRVLRDTQDVSTQFDISSFELLERPKSFDLSGKLQVGAKESATPGRYRLEVMFQDDSLRKAVSSASFRVAAAADKQGPQITFVSPAANTVLDNATSSVLVKVSAMDESGVDSIWIDGKPASLVDGIWSATVSIPVTDLGYAVGVKAWDKLGNASTSSITVGRKAPTDPGKPTTTVLQPVAGSVFDFDTTSVLVRWKVEDPRAVTSKVLIDGEAATGEANSVWSRRVNLVQTGTPTTITLVAINANNDSTTSFVQVTRSSDVKGPVLHITSPIEGVVLGYEVQSILVHAAASDASGVDSVKIDGKLATAGAADYTTLIDLPASKTTTIIVKAWDKLKNISVDSVHVTRMGPPDTSAPRLALVWPAASGFEVPLVTNSVTLKWLVTDLFGIGDTGVRIDGKVATRTKDTFSLAVGVPAPGKEQSFRIDAINAKGIRSFASVTIKRAADLVAPAVVRKDSGRAVGFDVRTAKASWTVSDNYKLGAVTINGQAVTGIDGLYGLDVTLGVGANPVVVIAKDSAGNTAKDSISIVRLYHDSINPVVKAADTLTKTRMVPSTTVQAVVSWDVTDNDAIQSVTIGGVVVAGTGKRFSRTVDLVVGDNKITIIAADTANNTVTESVTITRSAKDSVAPVITAGAGAMMRSIVYDSSTTNFNWTVVDNVGVAKVTVNDVQVHAGANGYAYTASGLVIGANNFTIAALDAAGNPTSLSFTITRAWKDTIAPTIARGAGTGPQLVANGTASATMTWTVKDTLLKSVSIQNTVVTGVAGAYSKVIPLIVGTNWVKISAIDQQGNASKDSFAIVRKAQAPTHTAKTGRYIGTVYDTLLSVGADSIQVSTDGKSWRRSAGFEAIRASGAVQFYAKAWPGGDSSKIDLTISQIKQVEAGSQFTWILLDDGTAWSAGFNGSGQLGTGSTVNEKAPIKVLDGVQSISAGGDFTLLLKTNGSVWATGGNSYGQLCLESSGIGSLSPVMVTTNATAIATGTAAAFISKTDNYLWSCGHNYSGELLKGRTSDIDSMLTRTLFTGITSVSAGDGHTVFIKADRNVWGAGANQDGQLGFGETIASDSIPQQIIYDAVAVSAGAYHSLILRSDRTAYSMGANAYGQIGNELVQKQMTPFQVPIPVGVTAVSAGRYHSLFLGKDARLFFSGMLVTSYPRSPSGKTFVTPEVIMSDVATIAAGDDFSIVTKSDGTLWAFGWNGNGQFGNGTTAPSEVPVRVDF